MRRLTMLLLFVLALGCEKPGCEKPDDTAEIRAVVDDLATRARAHDVQGMMKHAAPDFAAYPGSRDEQQVRPLLLLAMRQYGKFTIKYPVPGIRLDSDAGTAEVSVPFLVVREGTQFPSAKLKEVASDPVAWASQVAELVGDPYQLDLDFIKKSDGWKVVRADIDGFKRFDN